ncbi:MAG: hypothetical protein CMB11_03300 [Euryarchaeota archaeon]|nr:hypothetical protein [Euryarchaeota archaeon]
MNDHRNDLTGEVLAYEALHGAGGAVIHLDPASNGRGDKEYDEENVEVFGGDRNVLDTDSEEQDTEDAPAAHPAPASNSGPALWDPVEGEDAVNTDTAPKPVGAYPHARRVGDMLYLSGVGPRQPGTNAIPGGPIHDGKGQALDYDIKAQTRAVVQNVERVLKEAGGSLENVVDVTSFLVDMDRDFAGYNEVWADTLGKVGPTRTTLAIRSLPTPIAVEMKVVAHLPQ